MSRWEFMRQLEKLLSDISPNEREEALQYYNDYFNDPGMENEQQVIKALGSPEQVAKIVKDGRRVGREEGFAACGAGKGRRAASFCKSKHSAWYADYRKCFERNADLKPFGKSVCGDGEL